MYPMRVHFKKGIDSAPRSSFFYLSPSISLSFSFSFSLSTHVVHMYVCMYVLCLELLLLVFGGACTSTFLFLFAGSTTGTRLADSVLVLVSSHTLSIRVHVHTSIRYLSFSIYLSLACLDASNAGVFSRNQAKQTYVTKAVVLREDDGHQGELVGCGCWWLTDRRTLCCSTHGEHSRAGAHRAGGGGATTTGASRLDALRLRRPLRI